MPDFGERWKLIQKEPLGRGGQGKAFLVSDAHDATSPEYVAKVLNGAQLNDQSPRWKRLEHEIEVSKSFDHPNVVRVVDSGHTVGSGYPFFVMPHYSGGSLEKVRSRLSPREVFRIFAEICDGIAYLHDKGIVHRDIKPANIFWDSVRPIVGDLGLCFRFDAESLTETMEVATARWYGAPELRDGHLENPQPAADIYSLGKLLYWLFTGEVFDREEQSYATDDRKLATRLEQKAINLKTEAIDDRLIHAGAFADDLVSQTVRYQIIDRIQSAGELTRKVRQTLSRFEAGGHALDLSILSRCLFCGTGAYAAIEPFPGAGKPSSADPYKAMREKAKARFAIPDSGVGGLGPLILICQHCGHVQHFRFDWNPNALKNWKQ